MKACLGFKGHEIASLSLKMKASDHKKQSHVILKRFTRLRQRYSLLSKSIIFLQGGVKNSPHKNGLLSCYCWPSTTPLNLKYSC